MKNKDFLKILKHDIKFGTESIFCLYFIAILFILSVILEFQNIITEEGISKDMVTCADYLVYMFRGMSEYIPDVNKNFEISKIWIVLQIIPAIIIAAFPKKDLYESGMQIIVKSKSRKKWWNSKCIWVIIHVFIFYLLIHLIIIIVQFANGGKISFYVNGKLNMDINGFDFVNVNKFNILLMLVVVPVINAVTVSLFQMLLTFVTSPAIAVISVIGIHVLTAYYNTPLLTGNYVMILRNRYVTGYGISNICAVLINIVLVFIIIIIGNLYFQNCDFLRKNNEE